MKAIRHRTLLTLPGGMKASTRLAVIGDVHGRPGLLAEALLSIEHPWETDLVLLGDLISRGADSRECLLLADTVEGSGHFRSVTVLPGNHEAMMFLALAENHLAWRNVFMADGGAVLLSEFGGSEEAVLAALPRSLRRRLEGHDPVWVMNGDLLLVHAGVDPRADCIGILERGLAHMADYEAFREDDNPLWVRGRFLDARRAAEPFAGPHGPCIVVHGHSRIGPREPEAICEAIRSALASYRLPLDTSNGPLMAVLEAEGSEAMIKLVAV